MKHTLKVTIFLVIIFFCAQIIGLGVINQYMDHEQTEETGNITWSNLPYDLERPEIEETSSYAWIMAAILIGTALLLLLIRFRRVNIWKFWFFISVWLALSIAFGAFVNQLLAVILALALGIWKVFKPNIWVHNGTELFIYGGLAAIFVPIISVKGAFILLLIISIYDMIAVWKSKHMVKLAKFQTDSKVFAGLLVPYKLPKMSKMGKKKSKKVKVKTAVLGGGDIGFTLLFAGVMMKQLMLTNTIAIGFLKTVIITVTTTVALFWLLTAAKKDKFYPAMPFLSIGCVAGFIILAILGFIGF
ncbi:MAG: presenilin family intramembrane aspartyl protease [Nanoarchaeota archaeon]|nr:presenilin family intramembrane aspartyl protease [Nanoarchaeota archaeon]